MDHAVDHRHLQPPQVLHHIRFGNIRTQQGIDSLRLQGNNLLLRDIIQNIDDTVQHVAALEQFHQFACPLHRR